MHITVYEIFAVGMCLTLSFDVLNGPRTNVDMPIENASLPHSITYLMIIIAIVLFVIVSVIFSIDTG